MLWNQVFDLVLGIGAIVLFVATLALLVIRIAQARGRMQAVGAWLGQYGVVIAFVLSLIAVAGSLTYSNVIGYEPCFLCWWQRIFMYPQVILLGLALVKKEAQSIKKYALALSIIGAPISIYHILVQNSTRIASTAPCLAVSDGASCAVDLVRVFGSITIPMMCLSIFLAIIVVLSFKQK